MNRRNSRFHPLRAMQTRATAVGSSSESRLLPVGQRGGSAAGAPVR